MSNNNLGFGYYRMGSDQKSLEEFSKGYLNTNIVTFAPYSFEKALGTIRELKKLGFSVWLGIAQTVFLFSRPVTLIDNWETILRDMMNELEKEDLMDTVVGFYFDEPMLCGIKKDVFRDVTKQLRKDYPTLRVFTIFATNAIDPTVWSNGNDQVLDPDTTQYLTDAGYDMYWDVRDIDVRENKEEGGIEPYQKLNASLKARLGRDDVKIWYVPCIMNYRSQGDEGYVLAHLNAMYDFLKEEKNPGGLMCYAYDIHDHDGELGNIGFSEMRDQWKALEARLIEISNELLGK